MTPQRVSSQMDVPAAGMKRQEQIDFMDHAEERAVGYGQRWLADPAFRQALRRHDRKPA